jgi:hypothetical protein
MDIGAFTVATRVLSFVRFLISAEVLFLTLLLPSSVVSSISDCVTVLEDLGVLGDSVVIHSLLVLLLVLFKGLLAAEGHGETVDFFFDVDEKSEEE